MDVALERTRARQNDAGTSSTAQLLQGRIKLPSRNVDRGGEQVELRTFTSTAHQPIDFFSRGLPLVGTKVRFGQYRASIEPMGVFLRKLLQADDGLGKHAGIHQGDRTIEFGKSPAFVNCFLGSHVVRIDVAQLDEVLDRSIPNSITGRCHDRLVRSIRPLSVDRRDRQMFSSHGSTTFGWRSTSNKSCQHRPIRSEPEGTAKHRTNRRRQVEYTSLRGHCQMANSRPAYHRQSHLAVCGSHSRRAHFRRRSPLILRCSAGQEKRQSNVSPRRRMGATGRAAGRDVRSNRPAAAR